MNLGTARGLLKLARHRPQVLSVGAQNLTGRLNHRVRRSGKERSAPPEQVTVVVTDVCNLRCKMCQYAFSESPGYQLNRAGKMHPQLFRKLMDEIPGRPVVSITGGEPLLHPQVAEFVAYARSYGRFTTLTTNGWMLEKRAEELCEAGLDVLVVSVDGPEEIHDRVRGAKSFEKLAAGLEAVLARPRRPIVFVSMAISDLNYCTMVSVYEQALKWGVDGLNFNHLWMQTHGMVEAYNSQFYSMFEADEVAWTIRPEAVDTDQVAAELETVRRRNQFGPLLVTETPPLKQREAIGLWYQQPERFVRHTTTRCAWTRMKVWPDGGVKPCREWQAGNVAHSHATEVWNGQKFREFRQLLDEHGTLPICARCCYMAHR